MTTVQDILRAEYPTYASHHRVRWAVRWAVKRMLLCRTAALGGHVARCPDGHFERFFPNSCKHRSCVECPDLDRARWLRARVAQFALPIDYQHAIFTVPHELIPLWRVNRALVGGALLRAATQSLQAVFKEQWGSTPGIMAHLHTWSRPLAEHLHVHVLCTAGGYTADGWQACRESYFVSYDELRNEFRETLLEALGRALERGELAPPRGMGVAGVGAELKRLETCNWYVRAMARYRGSEGVFKYLSRYMRGSPFRNKQILRYENGEVTFRYQDLKTGTDREMTLSCEEFLRRLFAHIPEPAFRAIRYCGIFAPGNREKLNTCRQWLEMPPCEKRPPLTVEEYLAQFGVMRTDSCPICGKELIHEEVPRARGPTPPPPQRPHRDAA
jgi:hypothetical protein